MKIDSLILTHSGFKKYFDNRFVHYIQFVVLVLIGIYFTEFHLPKIITIFSFLIYSFLFYLFYKLKIGQIHSLSFFYQILLFFFLVPDIYYNPVCFFLSFSIYFFLLTKENIFLYFPFPVSIFLILINFIFCFLFSKLNILDFSNLYQLNNQASISIQLNPIFFPLSETDYQLNQYSTIEKSGILIFISAFVLILKNKDFIYEVLSLIAFGFILFLYYKFFSIAQIFNSIGIWYLFHFSLGKNNSVLKIFTFTSITFLALILVSLIQIKFSLLEIFAIYYTIYSIQFLLVKKFHFQKNLFLKIENRL